LINPSESAHVQQLLTGFHMLGRSGLIDVDQRWADSDPGLSGRDQLTVEVRSNNRSYRLHFDPRDGSGIDERALLDCDVYFKRSISAGSKAQIIGSAASRLVPLGLNYPVYPDTPDLLALRRRLSRPSGRRAVLRGAAGGLCLTRRWHFPRVGDVEQLPDKHATPRVLFMVGAWNPDDRPDRPSEQVRDRIRINETRAECIRELRREFGQRFLGGLTHTPFSTRHYGDVLLATPADAQKKVYLAHMQAYPICVATTGLHESTGWKLAEYVAASRAIVTEPLHSEVPGGFATGRNYLSFDSPGDCVAQVERLMTDDALRAELMHNNSVYYRGFVRPDALVARALSIALSGRVD
jgi:hypothetical protein